MPRGQPGRYRGFRRYGLRGWCGFLFLVRELVKGLNVEKAAGARHGASPPMVPHSNTQYWWCQGVKGMVVGSLKSRRPRQGVHQRAWRGDRELVVEHRT